MTPEEVLLYARRGVRSMIKETGIQRANAIHLRGGPPQVEDIVQDAAVSVYRATPVEITPAYVYRAGRTATLTAYRGYTRSLRPESLSPVLSESTTGSRPLSAEDEALAEEFRRYVGALGPEGRAVLGLMEEGASVRASITRLHMGRTRILNHLERIRTIARRFLALDEE